MTSKQNEQVDQVLVNCHLVIDATFSYLSARSLNTAAQVCTSWRDAVKRELKKRCWCECGLLRYDVKPDTPHLPPSFFHAVQNEPTVVLALNSLIMNTPTGEFSSIFKARSAFSKQLCPLCVCVCVCLSVTFFKTRSAFSKWLCPLSVLCPSVTLFCMGNPYLCF